MGRDDNRAATMMVKDAIRQARKRLCPSIIIAFNQDLSLCVGAMVVGGVEFLSL